jgi:site-specific DNA recombinase
MTTPRVALKSHAGPAVENAVGYIRVSTSDQAENGLSLPVQREAITRYCNQSELALLKIYEDPGRSGATIERPGLTDLLRDAKQRAFKKVIVWRLDRWSRDLYQGLWLSKELLVHGVEVVSISEPFNGQDPLTKAMRTIVQTFAELERDTIKSRLWSGRRKRLEQGKFAGGSVPLGYTLRDGELVLDAKAAETVRRIFKLRDQGLTFKQLAAKLNDAGIKPKQGKQWWPSTVAYICANRTKTYAGLVRYGETKPGAHKPIV